MPSILRRNPVGSGRALAGGRSPDGWTRPRGTVVVLADQPDYRFEFAPGRPRATAESSELQSGVLTRAPLAFGAVRPI
jgi:hypothetical protein